MLVRSSIDSIASPRNNDTSIRDVALEAAKREVRALRRAAAASAAAWAAERAAAAAAADEDSQARFETESALKRWEAEAAQSRAMEIEAYGRAGEAESALALLHAQLAEAAERTATLVESNKANNDGYSNNKQKIHQHMKLKEEIDELQRHNTEMYQRVHRAELREARAIAALALAGIDRPTGDKIWPTSPARTVGGHEGNENKPENAAAASSMGCPSSIKSLNAAYPQSEAASASS